MMSKDEGKIHGMMSENGGKKTGKKYKKRRMMSEYTGKIQKQENDVGKQGKNAGKRRMMSENKGKIKGV